MSIDRRSIFVFIIILLELRKRIKNQLRYYTARRVDSSLRRRTRGRLDEKDEGVVKRFR
jgi:hypothetical protein